MPHLFRVGRFFMFAFRVRLRLLVKLGMSLEREYVGAGADFQKSKTL